MLVEERFTRLEAEVASLRAGHRSHVRSTRQSVDQLRDADQQERGERRAADQAHDKKLEEVAVGGLHLETMGLVWLLVGVIASSVPAQLAAWLARIL
jgi:hypothetical protein